MNSVMPQFEMLAERPVGMNEEIWPQIAGLLAEANSREDSAERRRDHRYAFPRLIYLTPVDDDGAASDDRSMVAAGKDLSEGGLGFYHSMPLQSRRMIVSMERSDGQWLGFLLELSRSRSIRRGWYESSGRFVESTTSPMEGDSWASQPHI